MTSIAIIPARGGSKRIPQKNLRMFHGRPMIARSVGCALESRLFDRVIVSTDDDEIARIASAEGAWVPFRRPENLSNDQAPTMPVLLHCIDWWRTNVGLIDFACCIYATAPLLEPGVLIEGFELLVNSDADFVLSVTKFDYPIQRSLRLGKHGSLEFSDPRNALKRSQDLELRYHDAGQFFVGRVDSFERCESVLDGRCLPLIIPKNQAVDIDTEEDWVTAEKLFAIKNL
jgi:pseudaminic acid cytidylyltransferase